MIPPKKSHQTEALRAIKKGFKKYNRGQAIMACGTGKSYVAAWAAEQSKATTVLVLLPSLALVRQLLNDFQNVVSWKNWAPIAVCSDQTVAGRDSVYIDPSDVGCLVTTDPADVKQHLKEKGVRVVFCTYQSACLLQDFKFDLGIFDEAHKTAGRTDKTFGFALSDENIKISKRLFLTATPRVVRLPVDPDETEDVASMNDPKVYGPRFYELSFRDAVERKIICDYRIIISEINEDVDTEHHVALQVAIQKAMTEYGIKKAFSYHRTVKLANTFATDAQGFDPATLLRHVNGDMTTAVRKGLIDEFKYAKTGVLTNARCLTEGVDVPAVDMIVFAQAKRSVIDIVQAAGRAMRLSPGKQMGYIFIPLWRDKAKGETYEEAVNRAAFKPVLDVLRALAEQDALLEDVLEELRKGGGGGGGGTGPIVIDVIDLEKMRRAVGTALIETRRPKGHWTLERLRAAAKGCKTSVELRHKNNAAYDAALRQGLLDSLGLAPRRKPRGYWTKERCHTLALTYDSRVILSREQRAMYQIAFDAGWIDDICSHMPDVERKVVTLWTLKTATAEAKKYTTRTEFSRGSPGAQSFLVKAVALDNACAHMAAHVYKPRMYTKEVCLDAAKTCKTRGEFKKKHPAEYAAAHRSKWMNDIFPNKKKAA